ncbi:hypothetical protein GCM10011519_01490 [Marmoricola endophyticus]|uniref:Septum formation-related domain-containing protein n=1 Tax=Marmoricola endophyticus TaxID=2040280 RepID=A0A917F0X4_9ACTN|nr:septum formation family protein [Marmoricola endophyticus]GGF31831.1 hypothetical protein GCM10011519_01490 [Marmoricola endophyticus]
MSLLRTKAGTVLAAATLLGATACAGSTSDADVATTRAPSSADTSASSAAPSASASSSTPPRTPRVGECYRMDYGDATAAVSDDQPVDCSQPHTTQTAYVGTIDPYQDGHLLAVDSDRVQQRIAQACPAKVDAYVGGDTEQRRLSRVRAIWFSPTLQQSDAGASWYRCDAVAVRSEDTLASLPTRMKDALGTPRGDKLATCGTAAPDKPAFKRVTCDQKHTWEAISSVDLPEDAAYLGKAAGKDADARCKDEAADRADDPLSFTWSFQWPTKEDWQSGQRWGLCWVPS